MSDPGKAVFLSYASQDAEAAKRICEALRQAGVEVWFDAEGGLEHGDEWDAKIRRQIKECVLFLPIISANTQAREEGYFRIEWDLAAERARGIASGVAFILPVVIDDTRQPDALVPDRFRTVQWTKLPGGVVPPEVLQRLLKLWSHRTGALKHQAGPGDARGESRGLAPGEARLDRPGSRTYAAMAAAIFALVAVVGWWLLRSPRPGPAPAAAQATESEARRQVYEAHKLVQSPEGVTRERLAAADEMCRRALALDSLDPVVLAVAARIDANWVFYQFDKSEERKQQATSRAERAAVLAPQEPMVRLARAQVFAWVIGTPSMQAEAERMFRELSAVQEVASAANLMLGILLRDSGRTGEAAALYEEIGDLHSAGWAYLGAQRPEDAARVIERQLKDGHNRNALVQKLVLNLNFREDLDAVSKVIAQFTPQDLQQDSPAGLALNGLLAGRNAARLLEVVNGFPREVMASPGYLAPKRVFSGWAHHLAGRAELARTEWSAALATVQELRRNRTDDVTLLLWQALLQSRLGLEAEADATVHLIRSVTPVATPGLILRVELSVNAALGRTERFWATLAASKLPADERTPTHSWLRFSPDFDALRADPRFQAFLRENLPPGAQPLEDPKAKTLDPGPSDRPLVDQKSVAVLPFANLSDDKESGYFADGVHEDVLTNLAKISQLKVIARTSVMEYRQTTKKIPEIARELGVAYLLEGSVRRAGNRVRVVCQLIDGRTGQHVLAPDPFDRDLADIFAIQSEIAQGIAAKLQAVLAPTEKATLERAPTANLAAYELYLQAREIWGRSPDQRAGEEHARPLLERAVRLDPDFALAWQGLGFLHLRAYYRYDQSESRRLMAKQAIEKARELEPRDGEILALQTNYCIDVRDLPRARELASQLEREHPSLAVTWHVLARLSIREDRIHEALEYYRRARSLDPRNVAVLESLTGSLVTARRYEEAQAVLRAAGDLVETAPQLVWSRAVLPYYATGSTRGMDELAVRLAPDAARGDKRAISLLAGFASIRGDAAELVRLWEKHGSIVTVWGGDGTFAVAAALLIQGQSDRARPLLEQERTRYREWLASRPDSIDNWFSLAATHALLGDEEGTAAVKREMLAANPGLTRRGLWRYQECMLLAWLGDKDAALADLAERLAQGPAPAAIPVLRRGLRFRPLQGDPRFEALLNNPDNNAPLF